MNPQAFPSSVQNAMNGAPLEEMKGMDLRDYFAAKAIEGACEGTGGLPDGGYCGVLAERAYKLADAMHDARVK